MNAIKRTMTGKVTSNKMDKTAVVEVVRRVKHPVFNKYFTKKKRFKIHDEKNECAIGDKVLMRETKPISRDKNWVLIQVIEKAVIV